MSSRNAFFQLRKSKYLVVLKGPYLSKVAINLFTSSCLDLINVLFFLILVLYHFYFVIRVIKPIPNLFWILTNISVS